MSTNERQTGPRRISVAGATGGAGATTIAAAIALAGASPELAGDRAPAVRLWAHDLDDMGALLGIRDAIAGAIVARDVALSRETVGAELVVTDCGAIGAWDQSASSCADWCAADTRILVVRGPSYGALRAILRTSFNGAPASGVVLVHELGRSLGASDVTAVTELPILAGLMQRDKIARAIDAGVLVSRMPVELDQVARAVLVGDGANLSADR